MHQTYLQISIICLDSILRIQSSEGHSAEQDHAFLSHHHFDDFESFCFDIIDVLTRCQQTLRVLLITSSSSLHASHELRILY